MNPTKHRSWRLAATALALLVATACTSASHSDVPPTAKPTDAPAPTAQPGVLRVLAGSELQDMAPVLEEAQKATGVTVQFAWTGSLDGADAVSSGRADGKYDAVWFPSNQYLRLDDAGKAKLLSETPVMVSPVAVGVRSSVLNDLGWADGSKVTWAQIGDAASAGKLSYGMADPSRSNSGFSTLVAVASAFSGAGAALTEADVQKASPSLKKFFTGQKLTSGSSGWLAQAYTRAESGKVGALVNYESVLLSLNKSLAPDQQLTVVRPVDGVVSADYPLSLLTSASQRERESFQRLTAYLLKEDVQKRISELTLRRPVTPGATAAPTLPSDRRRELPFPGSRAVADGLLASYQNELRRPSRTVYVLDTSGSMEGARLNSLKAALGRLTGTDDTRGVSRFRDREEVTLISFASKVKWAKTHAVPASGGQPGPAAELASINADVQSLAAEGGTALYDSLEEAYRVIDRQQKAAGDDRFTSIVLMTDGESNEGATDGDFKKFHDGLPAGPKSIPVFPIKFGEAAVSQLQGIADLTGGKLFDGTASLDGVFEEIRGYQ
ncbi:substrate-binding and VWA domain-containing protein [Kitasatospora aureofaciens]|uniref:extracellular solute-binding protein n=1 Tax=Kitasatospora aureofaciens TaxID=1894 RepID=UPI001C495FEC|nr:extracellular solute-binding protein [Kitasatospora aureofaciens]MBV6699477.1 substrate-binding and VWA domain-containing protein [Kitasatospora aureofaciens]